MTAPTDTPLADLPGVMHARQDRRGVTRVLLHDQGDDWHAVWAPDGGLHLTIGIGTVPAHSPYQPGDWVSHHAGPRDAHYGRPGWCWRGYVIGSMGATILWGLTDDGREWSEQWGHLDPDGPQPRRDARVLPCVSCTPAPPRTRTTPEQRRPVETATSPLLGGDDA